MENREARVNWDERLERKSIAWKGKMSTEEEVGGDGGNGLKETMKEVKCCY